MLQMHLLHLLHPTPRMSKPLSKPLSKPWDNAALDARLSQKEIDEARGDGEALARLLKVLKILRKPDGCPWDREQTHQTLRPYMLEECHEVLDAIDRNDMDDLCEELGDLSLHVAFQAELAEERGDFRMSDSLDHICDKLIYRHPHVFGDGDAQTPEEVMQNWERLKTKEKKGKERESILDGLPESLPALLRAQRIQEKCAGVGFEWKEIDGAIEKFKEETGEFLDAFHHGTKEHAAEEFGDVLFSMVNIARYVKIHPEDALRGTNTKFARRFKEVEKRLAAAGGDLSTAGLKHLDTIWDAVKRDERKEREEGEAGASS
jgi:tetrapyrrole methylase family protein / MazG family protein